MISSDPLPVISLRNVGLSYKQNRGVFGEPFWAIRDVSFDLYRGETLGIVGRNGVGKSTLMRIMAGIIKPCRGSFVNRGQQTSLLSLNVGFLPYLSGRENAMLSGLLMGLSKKEIKSRMGAILEFSELGEFFDHPIATYSSGMSARLAFSVAMQVEPDVLLVDEILGVGDAEFRHKSGLVMRERMQSDKTVVFISHSAVEVEALCSRVVWIEDGQTRMDGEPSAVMEKYHHHLALE